MPEIKMPKGSLERARIEQLVERLAALERRIEILEKGAVVPSNNNTVPGVSRRK